MISDCYSFFIFILFQNKTKQSEKVTTMPKAKKNQEECNSKGDQSNKTKELDSDLKTNGALCKHCKKFTKVKMPLFWSKTIEFNPATEAICPNCITSNYGETVLTSKKKSGESFNDYYILSRGYLEEFYKLKRSVLSKIPDSNVVKLGLKGNRLLVKIDNVGNVTIIQE